MNNMNNKIWLNVMNNEIWMNYNENYNSLKCLLRFEVFQINIKKHLWICDCYLLVLKTALAEGSFRLKIKKNENETTK